MDGLFWTWNIYWLCKSDWSTQSTPAPPSGCSFPFQEKMLDLHNQREPVKLLLSYRVRKATTFTFQHVASPADPLPAPTEASPSSSLWTQRKSTHCLRLTCQGWTQPGSGSLVRNLCLKFSSSQHVFIYFISVSFPNSVERWAGPCCHLILWLKKKRWLHGSWRIKRGRGSRREGDIRLPPNRSCPSQWTLGPKDSRVSPWGWKWRGFRARKCHPRSRWHDEPGADPHFCSAFFFFLFGWDFQ